MYEVNNNDMLKFRYFYTNRNIDFYFPLILKNYQSTTKKKNLIQ